MTVTVYNSDKTVKLTYDVTPTTGVSDKQAHYGTSKKQDIFIDLLQFMINLDYDQVKTNKVFESAKQVMEKMDKNIDAKFWIENKKEATELLTANK